MARALVFKPLAIVTEDITSQDKDVQCLLYNSTDEEGKTKVGYISLDKKWFKPGRGGHYIGEWVQLKIYNSNDLQGTYGYEDPNGGSPYSIYSEIIKMVDDENNRVFEEQVLGWKSETRTK